jgi:hypothetical protein
VGGGVAVGGKRDGDLEGTKRKNDFVLRLLRKNDD